MKPGIYEVIPQANGSAAKPQAAEKQQESEDAFGTGDPEKEAAALAAFQASGVYNPAK